MAEEIVVVIKDKEVVVINDNTMPGPPGPAGICKISTDLNNAITQGTDGGVYCSAVISGLSHW